MTFPYRMILACAALVGAGLATIFVAPIQTLSEPKEFKFHDDFNSGSLDAWQFPFPEDWVIKEAGPLHYLHMVRNREPLLPRRPQQFARLKDVNVGSFTLEARVRRAGSSMLMAFNYVDSLHFYYVHFSADPGAKVDVHNGIFLVDGAPRRRIAGIEAAPVLSDTNWHRVRVERNVQAGSITVFVDDTSQARFSVIDRTFQCGQVGLGSFDETGDFADFKLSSDDAGCHP